MTETPFIPRRWANGLGLTAILPTVPGNGPELCAIYDIPGQHGSGSAYRALSSTEPASPEETEQLRKELQQIGYPAPTPYRRLSQRMHRERRQNWRIMLDALSRQMDVSRETPLHDALQEDESSAWYLNHYRHCGTEWDDEWSAMCNDRCPVCNAEIEPYASEEMSSLVIPEAAIGTSEDALARFPELRKGETA